MGALAMRLGFKFGRVEEAPKTGRFDVKFEFSHFKYWQFKRNCDWSQQENDS
jgi:hypothetical protein